MVWNEDQKALQGMVRRFARERLLPGYQRREVADVLDRELVREMGALGLLAADVPEAFGGLGLDGVTTGLICEELAYGDLNLAGLSVEMSLLAAILMRDAPAHVTRAWVPRMTRGESIVAICVTEPRGGSDASNLQMRARRDGNDFILNGEKTSISFADSADAFLVFARSGSQDSGARGISAFFVPGDAPGIERTRFNDLGCRIQGRGSVFFDNVRVPAANILAEEGKGFTQVMVGFDYSRALIALQCLGAAQASLDEGWAYAREREAFGRPIAQFQGVTFPLVEGESMVAAVRQLAYHALALRDAGLPHTAEAAMVKWMGPKTAVDVIHQCLLTFGHYGYSLDTPHQQRMRDVMGLEIGDGTAGVMKLIIAREKAGRVDVQYL
ncbi:acyl-CoA dehydrogenase family protein [Aromatoleum aromaticum]|uniref:acyl-CoA dehydrogenase family protein n=1 Tax=Aromatoleum aromaticum TaxID=551760 RepID=UPI001459E5FA|nr:acyl-CoA dehydrogenase family protein [Aromatoleum aromaticum]NMG55171.1 cyclohexanecarboxyl-CoA dehydrogenase [Aromatoleum aromaticum]